MRRSRSGADRDAVAGQHAGRRRDAGGKRERVGAADQRRVV